MSEIIVSCEGIPALFSFVVGSSDHGGACIPLKGNALDVALLRVSSTLSTLAVSIDNVHVQGSTSELRRGHVSDLPTPYAFSVADPIFRHQAQYNISTSEIAAVGKRTWTFTEL